MLGHGRVAHGVVVARRDADVELVALERGRADLERERRRVARRERGLRAADGDDGPELVAPVVLVDAQRAVRGGPGMCPAGR